MENEQLHEMINIANYRINCAICEAVLEAMKAVTKQPDLPGVIDAHVEACAEAYSDLELAERCAESVSEFGTKAEWDALPDDQKADEWVCFHDLCAQGIGDEMYFYKVLMNEWQVGYVGH